MADLTNGSGVYQTYNNSGTGVAELGDNFGNFAIAQSDAGREFIISITADAATLTTAKLAEAVRYLTRTNYTSANTDGTAAGTIAALGTSDGTAFDPTADTVVYVRYQTTEDFAVTDFNAAQSNTTLAVVCEFKPAK